MPFDHEAYRRERHTDKLSTEGVRKQFVDQVSPAMEQMARQLISLAIELRDNPERLLQQAFSPSIDRLLPNTNVAVEISVFGTGALSVKGFARVDGKSPSDSEVGFHVMCKSGTINPREDPSMP